MARMALNDAYSLYRDCCQNENQEQHRVANLSLRSAQKIDPAKKARVHATRKHIEDYEERQQALQAEHKHLTVRAS